MIESELNSLQMEAFEHLHKGRARLAYPMAEKIFNQRSDNSIAALCYAWACLEMGEIVKAKSLTDLSETLQGDTIITNMYLGYMQMRLSSFEGAIYNFNMSEGLQKNLLAWTYLNKAKSLVQINEIEKGIKFFNLALLIDNNSNPEWKELKKYFSKLDKIDSILKNELQFPLLLDTVKSSIKEKENWFALFTLNKIAKDKSLLDQTSELRILHLEVMLKMNQFTAIKEKIVDYQNFIIDKTRLEQIVNAVNKYEVEKSSPKQIITDKNNKQENEFITTTINEFVETDSFKLFDYVSKNSAEIKNLTSVDLNKTNKLGLDVILKNKLFQKSASNYNCFIAWYQEDDLLHHSSFELEIPADWDAVQLNDECLLNDNNLWRAGEGRIEIYLNKVKVLEYSFTLGNIEQSEEISIAKNNNENQNEIADEKIDIKTALDSLEKIVGLENVKKSIHDLIDYLAFMKERKQLGLKAQDKLALHLTFIGSPGTGKTTVARLMGKIFRAMGILEKGEVIEVDRTSLVGQYVGETAQKTEKILEEAIGNVLFVDEAYTLVKKGASNDFGKEAIDAILKKMEDRRGDFIVIAAGYQNEMEDFLTANPGLKSRFTHNFIFEDYNPSELIKIFENLSLEEDYVLMNSAKVLLEKEFVKLYRNRDENFGNARTVRKFFEEIKMSVSKRYLSLPIHQRDKQKLITITENDVQNVMRTDKEQSNFQIPINEEELSEALNNLNKLAGLISVKNEVSELVKLARFYKKENENLADKFSSHIVFLGNPGTGKTTVARIISKIYSALGILPTGQLVETDRQSLVSGYIGQTAIQTKSLIDKAIGGTLFIDEAYTLSKKDGSNDFGQESIDTLLKRMEDDKGKFIVIAAGYTEEMKSFLESNPGMKSRFSKTFVFEDYTPDDMMLILKALFKKENLTFTEETEKEIKKYFNNLYRDRDKNFGNARIVRNTFEMISKKHQLRLISNEEEISADQKNIIILDDLNDLIKPTSAKIETVKGDEEKLQQYLHELNELTGLTEVKDGIEKLVNSLKIAKLRKERGMEIIQKPLHSVFTGNPGTGKTTVARLLSKIFKELGIISKGHLVEVDRAKLVAGYSGQTAIKTDEIISSAIGGTLFIDEAYTLSRSSNDFGQEAIDTLLKRMEDYKNDFIVIVAGYTNEMRNFMNSNPGLTSRFSSTFNFEDYKPADLLNIAENLSIKSGYKFSPEAQSSLLEKFNSLYNSRDNNFGNARLVRNIFYDVVSNQESRLSQISNLSDDELTTIQKSDIDY